MNLLIEAKEAWEEYTDVNSATHASSIAYYTFLSLVPLLALCISLISLVGVDERALLEHLAILVPDALDGLVAALVADAFKQSNLAFSISSLSLVWTASKGAKALRTGLNAAYGEEEDRGAIVVAAISIVAVIVLGVLIAATMWLVFGNSMLHALSQHISGLEPLDGVSELVNMLETLLAGVFALGLCYTFLPAGKRRFVSQLPGAACATVGCGILTFGYRIYVDNFANSTMLYGSMAAVALLLFWMYLVFCILIAAGFLNRYLQERRVVV